MILRSTALGLALATCFGFAAPARAQRDLEPSIIESGALSDADKTEIRQFLTGLTPELTGEPVRIKASRERIVRQLRAQGTGSQPSIAFRLEYARQLLPVVEPLIVNEGDLIAANALIIAGELGVPAASPILERGLADKRPPVRYGAAFGYKRLFERLIQGSPALTSKQATDALGTVVGAIPGEIDTKVIEGLLRALEAGAKVPAEQVKDLRSSSVSALATTMGARAAADAGGGERANNKLDLSRALLRASQIAHDALTRVHMDKNEPQLPTQSLVDVGGLSGDILAYVRARLAAPDLASDERDRLTALTKSAESVYHFTNEALGGPLRDPALGSLLDAGDTTGFSKAVVDLIGPSGPLTTAPFGYADDRFVR
ncbi:MAG: hypothetical protein H7Y88_08630 [Phycisphaerales bacterium]|nr:hypothetical protein [Phycisphaerales bacterium]